MKKNKHLNQEDRNKIEEMIKEGFTFKTIAERLCKDPTTISKEIKGHIQFQKTGAYGRVFNDCLNRKTCVEMHVCNNEKCYKKCSFCKQKCYTFCNKYIQEECVKLLKPPYVCNGCKDRNMCTLEKRIYDARYAQKEYKLVLSETRQGVQISEEEVLRLDKLISPLIKKGQSLHHICVSNTDTIMLNERTLYNYVASSIFAARNIDMPRVVRMSRRKPKKEGFKVDKACRIGRTYQDFLEYLEVYCDTPVVEMDTVEGKKGGKVLLTIHFTVPQLMLAFLRDANTSKSVTDIFKDLRAKLGEKDFVKLFRVILGDNGSEFSNPLAIEQLSEIEGMVRVFYCNPQASYQKGSIENNHSLLRRIIPKGAPLDSFTQSDIDKAVDHINSYIRSNLGDRSAYQIFAYLYGEQLLKKLGCSFIPASEVELKPSLLK